MQSRILHQSQHYTASLTRVGLIFQSTRGGTGKLLPTNHPQFNAWALAFDDLLDQAEGDDLCRAMLRS
jgi:hypothetical protein